MDGAFFFSLADGLLHIDRKKIINDPQTPQTSINLLQGSILCYSSVKAAAMWSVNNRLIFIKVS